MEIFGGQGFGLGSGRDFVHWCMDWCSVHVLVVYVVDVWGWWGGVAGGRGGVDGVRSRTWASKEMIQDWIAPGLAEVGEAVGREDSGEVEVAMSMGEGAE